jgi:hypothetical protein
MFVVKFIGLSFLWKPNKIPVTAGPVDTESSVGIRVGTSADKVTSRLLLCLFYQAVFPGLFRVQVCTIQQNCDL